MAIELETMIVRLTGDGSQFKQMLDQAANAAKSFASNVTSVLGALGFVTGLKSAFDQFTKLETGQIRLRAAIEANNGSVEELTARYVRVADQIAATTLNTKGSVLAMFQQVEMFGRSGDAAERVVRNAIALAAATDRDASSMIAVTNAMEQGNYALLRRLPGLRGIRDETELVAKAQQMMATGMRVSESIFNSTAGRVERMGRSLKFLGTELGALLADVVNPLVEKIIQLTEAFKKLDPVIRKTVVGVIALSAGTKLLGGYITSFLGPVLSLTRSVGGLLVSGSRLAILFRFSWIGAAIALVAGLVSQLGGLTSTFNKIREIGGGVWTWIQQKASEFWNWVQPIIAALGDLMSTVWTDVVMPAISAFWNFVSTTFQAIYGTIRDAWQAIVGSTNTNWTNIRDGIVDAILFAEFTIKNFGATANYIWASIKYGFATFVDSMRNGLINVVAFVGATGNMIVGIFEDVWRAISGEGAWRDVFANIQTNFDRTFNDIRRSLGHGQSEGARQFGEEMDRQAQILGESFSAFREQRRARGQVIAAEQVREAERLGQQVGQALNKGTEREIGKFDAALRFSAEAISRITEYVERLNAPRRGVGNPAGGIDLDGEDGGAMVPSPSPAAAALVAQNNVGGRNGEGLLRRIATATEQIARGNNNLTLSTASLNG